jgi:hypothetical protein
MIENIKEWFLSLGAKYNVDPVVFGVIYVGAIPFFFLSVWWIVRNYKMKKSIVLPVMSTGLCFVSAYLYLIIVGKNIPFWVYFFIAAMVVYGIYSTIRKVRSRVRE